MLVSVRWLFLCIKRPLPLLIVLLIVASGSLVQTKDNILLADSLIEYGPITITYRNEAEALTFAPASSTLVKQLTWKKEVQQDKDATGKTVQSTTHSTSAETPPQWLGKEQFLVILSPKDTFTVEINGYRKRLASPGVNTQIRLTPLLKANGGATTIKIISDQNKGDIDALASEFLLMSTPDIHFATSQVRVFHKYPENYRGLFDQIPCSMIRRSGLSLSWVLLSQNACL